MTDFVNIVTPVYNAQKTLIECIESVLKQTVNNWSLTLVDDGSTDSSGTICDEYAEKDRRITVLHQNNKGSYEARNTGIQHARKTQDGYITFLDADDRLPENAIEIYTKQIQEHNADIICGRTKRAWKKITIDDRFVPACYQIESPKTYDHDEFISKLSLSFFGISNYPVSLWGKCFKTSLFNELEEDDLAKNAVHFFGDDLKLCLPLSLNAKNILITNEYLYQYRIGGGTSKFNPYFMDDFIGLYNYKKPFIERYNVPSKAYLYMDIEIINCFKSYLIMCKENGKMGDTELTNEINRYIDTPILQNAAQSVNEHYTNKMADMILRRDISEIVITVNDFAKKNRVKNALKNLLYSI